MIRGSGFIVTEHSLVNHALHALLLVLHGTSTQREGLGGADASFGLNLLSYP